MTQQHFRRAVIRRSGKPRRGITIQVNEVKHKDLLEWLDKQESIQATILNALYAKMYSESSEDGLADTKPMIVPELEPDPTLLKELYDALIAHMNQNHRETRAMLRDLRENIGTALPNSERTSELKPELKKAMIGAMKPGKSI
jgi:hypothetical protein